MSAGHAVSVPIHRLPHGEAFPAPEYATQGSVGCDLYAALGDAVTLETRCYEAIPTGICISLPLGFEGQVRPRSGLARDHGVTVLNVPGTIDQDYRGEIIVLLINHGADPFTVEPGMRIAQLVVAPVTRVSWDACSHLEATDRGRGGFGSTGR